MTAPALTWTFRATLKRAIDGDTLLVLADVGFGASMTVELRLKDINTPEIVGPERALGFAARDALAAKIGDQVLTIQTFKTRNDTDVRSFTRWVARVWLPDGTDLAAWLVENGFAVAWVPS